MATTEDIFKLQYQINNDSLSKNIEVLNELKDAMTKARAELKQYDDLRKKGIVLTQEQINERKQLLRQELTYKQQITDTNAVIKTMVKTIDMENGSIKQQAAQLTLLIMQYQKLSKADREGDIGKQLLTNIQKLDPELKKFDAQVGRFQRNVGNYKSALSGMGGGLFNNITAGLKGLGSQLAVTGGQVKMFLGRYLGLTALIYGGIRLYKNATSTIIDFEKANVDLAAILGRDVKEIEALTNSAERLGATTRYTASEVTQLQTELAKLGFNEGQIETMQEAVLNFATALGANLGDAAALVGATMRSFNLTAKDAERIADVLTAGANKSALSFEKYQTSLAIVSPVANAFNFSLEDTVALLGTLSNAGFDASSAGTALRNILLNLADSGGKLAQALGKPVRTLPELLDGLKRLKAQGIDLNQTLELTDKRSVAAFNAFLTAADGAGQLADELHNANGEAEDMAEKKLDNVAGSLDLLKSAWEGLILSFKGSAGVIKDIIDGLTGIVELTSEIVNPKKTASDKNREEIANEKAAIVELANKYGDADKAIAVYQRDVVDYQDAQTEAARKQYEWLKLLDEQGSNVSNKKLRDAKNEYDYQEKLLSQRKEALRLYKEEGSGIVQGSETPTGGTKPLGGDGGKKRQEALKKQQDEYRKTVRATNDAILKDTQALYDAEVAAMYEGIEKKIALNELAAQKERDQLNATYRTNVEAIDKAAKTATGSEYEALMQQREELTQVYEARIIANFTTEENKRIAILQAATTEELQVYRKAATDKQEIDDEITNNEREERDKRLAAARTKTDEAIATAQAEYDAAKLVNDKSTASAKQRAEREKQITANLLTAKMQAWEAELKALAAIGELSDEQAKKIIEDINKAKQALSDMGVTDSSSGSKGEKKKSASVSWAAEKFNLSDSQAEELQAQYDNLWTSITDSMVDIWNDAVDRRLKKEKKAITSEYSIYSKMLDDKRDKGLISEKTYQAELEKMEAEKLAKEEAAEKKAFDKKKRLSILEALINTALSITSTAKMGFPQAIPFIAIAAALGAVQVAAIASQTYAEGGIMPVGDNMGIIQGRPHSQGGNKVYIDGTPIGEVEGDELIAIVNKRDTRRLAELSQLNSKHGRRFAFGGRRFAEGGIMNTAIPTASTLPTASTGGGFTGEELDARSRERFEVLSQRIDNIKVYVTESDITDTQRTVKRAEVRATF